MVSLSFELFCLLLLRLTLRFSFRLLQRYALFAVHASFAPCFLRLIVKLCKLNIMTGEEVKKLRESLGLNQREFGERCGVKVRAVQYWEANGVSGQNEVLLKSLTGEGAKIAASGSAVAVNGSNASNVNAGDALSRAFDEIAAQRRVTEKAQAQIDELLSIVKVMAGGSSPS